MIGDDKLFAPLPAKAKQNQRKQGIRKAFKAYVRAGASMVHAARRLNAAKRRAEKAAQSNSPTHL